jgi:hypothetical protein
VSERGVRLSSRLAKIKPSATFESLFATSMALLELGLDRLAVGLKAVAAAAC